MEFVFNDGGRSKAGFNGTTGDCTCRAISIAMPELSYRQIYDRLIEYGKRERFSKRNRIKSHPRTGVNRKTIRKFLEDHGFIWRPCMSIGSGCRVHLKKEELPSGRIICSLSKHLTAVVDGVINDIYDCSREETRCVYGYWYRGE